MGGWTGNQVSRCKLVCKHRMNNGKILLYGSVSQSVVSDSLGPQELWPTGLLCPWDFLGKNTGVGCHCLLQGILPT